MNPLLALFGLAALYGASRSVNKVIERELRLLESEGFDDATRVASELGSHVIVSRLGYVHHGIYVGNHRVIHYSGEPTRKRDASVRESSVEDFASGGEIMVLAYSRCDSPATVIDRARSRLGERDYDLIRNNCEHFATWCKLGEGYSDQVERVSSSLEVGMHAPVALMALHLADRLQAQISGEVRTRPFELRHA